VLRGGLPLSAHGNPPETEKIRTSSNDVAPLEYSKQRLKPKNRLCLPETSTSFRGRRTSTIPAAWVNDALFRATRAQQRQPQSEQRLKALARVARNRASLTQAAGLWTFLRPRNDVEVSGKHKRFFGLQPLLRISKRRDIHLSLYGYFSVSGGLPLGR